MSIFSAVAALLSSLAFQPFASGFNAPVYVAAPRSEPGVVYVVEQTRRDLAAAQGRPRPDAVPRRAQLDLIGRGAGTALGRLRPGLREEPPLLRRLHRHERRHASRASSAPTATSRPAERRDAAALRQAAVPEPQRRPAPVRAGRLPLRRHGRRRLGRRSRENRAQNLKTPARQAAALQRGAPLAERRPTGSATRGASRSTAPRAPLDRRRRPGHVGGDRHRQRAASGSPTSAGASTRAAPATHRARPSGTGQLVFPVCVYPHATTAARSRAGTSTAAEASRRRAAATSSATTAPGRSGATPAARRRRSRVGPAARRRSARTARASSTRRRSPGRIFKLAAVQACHALCCEARHLDRDVQHKVSGAAAADARRLRSERGVGERLQRLVQRRELARRSA